MGIVVCVSTVGGDRRSAREDDRRVLNGIVRKIRSSTKEVGQSGRLGGLIGGAFVGFLINILTTWMMS